MRLISRIIFVLFLLCTLILTCNAGTEDVKQNIIRQSKLMNVEPEIMLSIAKTESGFNQSAHSAGGHIGVYQLSKSTAKTLGLNPYDLNDNIKGGILYYKSMYEKFGSIELAVAAYNVGPEAIKRHNNKVPHYTKHFVSKIMSDYNAYKKLKI